MKNAFLNGPLPVNLGRWFHGKNNTPVHVDVQIASSARCYGSILLMDDVEHCIYWTNVSISKSGSIWMMCDSLAQTKLYFE